MLRDIKFTLKTDHKNLIYINDTATPMIIRWKLAIQEFDFKIEHIPGKDNIVADGFSRLVPNSLAALVHVDPEEQEFYLCPLISESCSAPEHIRTLLGRAHNSKVGHGGLERTINKVRTICIAESRTEPQQLRSHVQNFIKKCPCCQKMSFIKIPVQTNPFTTASYEPHQRLNIDTIGPVEKDKDGNVYILVIIDTFTRWIELYPTKTVAAEECVEKLLQHFGRFGTPTELLTDNGTQFVNKTVIEIMRLLQVQHTRTLAYSKQENAIVERANKEVLRHLRALVYDSKVIENWGTYLPLVQRIINSTKHESTNASPAQLLFGNAINLDRGMLITPTPVNGEDIKLSKWAADMLSTQQRLMQHAHTTQLIKDQRHMLKARPVVDIFEKDSYVLIEYHDGLKKGPPSKLLTNLKGPYKVLGNQGAHYTVRNLRTNKDETYHATALRPFYYDILTTDPRDVAIRDNQEFVVESIVEHRGDKRRKSEMEFKIRWQGYNPEADTWGTWKDLRLVPKLHDYLREHNMASLVPSNLE